MRILIEHDGTFEIRPESPLENYALRQWHQDWKDRKVILRLSYKDDDGEFINEIVQPR
jgi:hypothetical protein